MTSPTADLPQDYEMPTALLRQWILGGLVSAASRFTPVPLVDDMIETQALKYVVAKTFKQTDLNLDNEAMKPLYDESGGFITRVLKKAARLPLRILTFPFRKAVRLVTSIRGVPMDLMYAVLLGRCVDRSIKAGIYQDSLSQEQIKALNTDIRSAFEESVTNIDLQVLRHVLPKAWDQTLSWFDVMKDRIADLLKKQGSDPEIEASAQVIDISDQFESDEVRSFMEGFDQKFDRNMAAQTAR